MISHPIASSSDPSHYLARSAYGIPAERREGSTWSKAEMSLTSLYSSIELGACHLTSMPDCRHMLFTFQTDGRLIRNSAGHSTQRRMPKIQE